MAVNCLPGTGVPFVPEWYLLPVPGPLVPKLVFTIQKEFIPRNYQTDFSIKLLIYIPFIGLLKYKKCEILSVGTGM
jgi:hypothetical protein